MFKMARLSRFILAAFIAAFLTANASGAETYSNSKYGYSFECPDQYSVSATSDYYFSVHDGEGKTVLTGQVEDISLHPRDLYEGYSDPFQKFGTWRAILRCDADGPDGSAYCPSLKSIQEFRTRNGLRALELLLMHVQEFFGETPKREESVTGPLYLVDLSRGKITVVLMLGARPYERMTEEQEKLAASVLDSIKFLK
jgi:hypothetical protein